MIMLFRTLIFSFLVISSIAAFPEATHTEFETMIKDCATKDFPGQDFEVVFDYPEVLKKLPENPEIVGYKNLGQGRIQVNVKGIMNPIGAKVNLMVLVPVLNKPLSPSHIIEADDVIMTKVPLTALNGQYALRVEELIGKQSKQKVLGTLTPILATDLTAPIVMKRDSLVRIVYRAGNLSLSTQAKALKDGSTGQRITFETTKNPKKVLEATVVDENSAEINATT